MLYFIVIIIILFSIIGGAVIGLAPQISKTELRQVKSLSKQLNDSKKIIYSTIKPEIFFSRIGFALDILLELKKYEKYKIFKDKTPTNDYNNLMVDLEDIVNSFIDRSHQAQLEKVSKLKTKKAKDNNMDKYFENMKSCFAKANTFWEGDKMKPHHEEHLCTENNLKHLNNLIKQYENEKNINFIKIG